jgi:uncharacterized protein
MKKLIPILFSLILSFSANADLELAVAFAEAGDVKKGQMELVSISQRAMDGDPKSMCEFGEMYAKEGYWIVQSDEDASKWWLKSAEMGYVPCQFAIGAAYIIGFGIEKDLSKAKSWLQKTIDSSDELHSEAAEAIYAIHELAKY